MPPTSAPDARSADRLFAADDPRPRVLSYLRHHHTVTLATSGPDGPWAATVFYVNREFDLYFQSKTSTRHIRHLAADPRVAATVSQDPGDWRAIQGVQLQGRVECVTEADEHMQVMRGFFQRYPFVETLWGEGSGETADAAARRVYRVRPERLVFHDHEQSSEPCELSGPTLRMGCG